MGRYALTNLLLLYKRNNRIIVGNFTESFEKLISGLIDIFWLTYCYYYT